MGFAVGIVCILVGLIVSWPAVAAGAGIALVFGFLWVRDVTRGYRKEPEPEPEAAEAAEPAGVPEAAPEPAEPARYPRDKFLEGATLGLGAVIGGIVTIPAIGFAVVPAFVKQGHPQIDAGPLSDYPEGQFVVTTFLLNPPEGEVSRRTLYIRYNGLLEGKPSFTVLSNRCVHLGCPVQPNGPVFDNRKKDVRTKQGEIRLIPTQPAGFGCPCHGGQYDTEGNRIAGPPVRALDRYQYIIDNGRLLITNSYSVAYVDGQGAQAVIKKYGLAGPGQHIDGPEAWLYPLQPPH